MDVRDAGVQIAAFLEAPRYGVIATHDPDGEIWQAVVWYALTDEGILMNARNLRRWLTNLRRDGRASLVIADGEDYVIVRGQAVVTDNPEQAQVEAQALATRYGSDESFAGQHRVGVVLHAERLAVHGELHLGDQPT